MTDLSRYPVWAAIGAISARAAAEHERRVAAALVQLRAVLGRDGVAVGWRGEFVVARSSVEEIRRAFPPRPSLLDMYGLQSWHPLYGIPIVAVADWKMNPATVAQARLVAIVLRPFARLLRWVGRHHPASES